MKTIVLFCGLACLSFTHRATYYSDHFVGRPTTSGEIFSQNLLTCASNIYPIGTRLKLTNIENGKSVVVRVNDTGGFKRVTLDLSKKAFRKIADLKIGIVKIKIKKLCK
jgi:rare lipoprotein A